MKRACLVPVAALAATLSMPSATLAATIRALPLPVGFTVKPEGEDRLISIAPDATVVALSDSADFRTRAFRWAPDGRRTTFAPLAVRTEPGYRQYHQTNDRPPIGIGGVVAGPNGLAYINASKAFSGAYGGVSFEAQQWTYSGTRYWDAPSCAEVDGSESDQHVRGVDAAGRVALTYDITGAGAFTVLSDTNGQYAPYAVIVEGRRCRYLGRAVVEDLRGAWAVGYRAYLDGHLAPTNLNVIVQQAVAVRWHGSTLSDIGHGAAMAVTSDGFAVGGTAVPGRFMSEYTNFYGNPGRHYTSAAPSAVAWDVNGREITLARDATRSVAYDVGDDKTAVGMLQAADGKHYAFRWRHGRLRRLDDLPHPPGWRFESAYAVAPDGTIAGIGTFNGVATVFTWRD